MTLLVSIRFRLRHTACQIGIVNSDCFDQTFRVSHLPHNIYLKFATIQRVSIQLSPSSKRHTSKLQDMDMSLPTHRKPRVQLVVTT